MSSAVLNVLSIIYLEIRDEDASKEYYLRHNKFLDSLDIENEDFEYFIFTIIANNNTN